MQGQTRGEKNNQTINQKNITITIVTRSQSAKKQPTGLNLELRQSAKFWKKQPITGVISTHQLHYRWHNIEKAIRVRVSACVTQYLQLAELLSVSASGTSSLKAVLTSFFKQALNWWHQRS